MTWQNDTLLKRRLGVMYLYKSWYLIQYVFVNTPILCNYQQYEFLRGNDYNKLYSCNIT